MIPINLIKNAASEASDELSETKEKGGRLFNKAMSKVGLPAAAHPNANPVYSLLSAVTGGKAISNEAGDTLYSWDKISDTDAMNKLNEIAEMIRGDKAGTALRTTASPLINTLAVASPVLGAVGGAVGDAGLFRGALRGLGFGAGGLGGTYAGAMLADRLAQTDAVKGLSPAMQAVVTAASTLGGGALGSYLGHKATKALSKSDKEKYEEAVMSRNGLA